MLSIEVKYSPNVQKMHAEILFVRLAVHFPSDDRTLFRHRRKLVISEVTEYMKSDMQFKLTPLVAQCFTCVAFVSTCVIVVSYVGLCSACLCVDCFSPDRCRSMMSPAYPELA